MVSKKVFWAVVLILVSALAFTSLKLNLANKRIVNFEKWTIVTDQDLKATKAELAAKQNEVDRRKMAYELDQYALATFSWPGPIESDAYAVYEPDLKLTVFRVKIHYLDSKQTMIRARQGDRLEWYEVPADTALEKFSPPQRKSQRMESVNQQHR